MVPLNLKISHLVPDRLINQMLRRAVSQNKPGGEATAPLCWRVKIPAVQFADGAPALTGRPLATSPDRLAHPFSLCLLTRRPSATRVYTRLFR